MEVSQTLVGDGDKMWWTFSQKTCPLREDIHISRTIVPAPIECLVYLLTPQRGHPLSRIFLEKFTWGGKMEYLNFVGGQGLCTVYSRVMSNS